MREDCLEETKFSNCLENHPTLSRSCGVNQRVGEIMEVKYRRNVTFFEIRKAIGSYMKEKSYATVAWKTSLINKNMEYE